MNCEHGSTSLVLNSVELPKRMVGCAVDLGVAPGKPQSYFNRSPWLEKTVASADRFLLSLGYLSEEPQ